MLKRFTAKFMGVFAKSIHGKSPKKETLKIKGVLYLIVDLLSYAPQKLDRVLFDAGLNTEQIVIAKEFLDGLRKND